MAIRDVRTVAAPAQPAAPAAGGLPKEVEKSLSSTGIQQPGQSPKEAAQGLLSSLQDAGFGAALKGELSSALAGAVRSFQAAEGLPKTGKLDPPTADALKNAGLVAGAEPMQAPPEKGLSGRDGFEKAPSLAAADKPRVVDMKMSTPDTNFLDALLQKLGGDQGVTSDKQGTVGGTAQTATQQSEQTSAADAKKAVEGGEQKKGTSEAQKDVRDTKNQAPEQANGAKVQVARGLRAQETKTDERRRRDTIDGKDPAQASLLEEEADEAAVEGDGGGGQKRGRGGDNDGGHDETGTAEGGTGKDEGDGNERHAGNASSGNADPWDPRRGHALLDDDPQALPGHYRVPTLAEQAQSALAEISMDASASNKATTYSWDVTFYKPGIYSPGQKPTELVHLVVNAATAFDAVWQEAQQKLSILVRRLERDGAVPSHDDIIQALRQARSRGGDPTAASLASFRPPTSGRRT
jgi:hypothetical protein